LTLPQAVVANRALAVTEARLLERILRVVAAMYKHYPIVISTNRERTNERINSGAMCLKHIHARAFEFARGTNVALVAHAKRVVERKALAVIRADIAYENRQMNDVEIELRAHINERIERVPAPPGHTPLQSDSKKPGLHVHSKSSLSRSCVQ
jgi:hypothetical protein